MDKIIVTISGVIIIAIIYWFFFGKKEEAVSAFRGLEIIVDGGYKPQVIEIEKDKKTELTFIRKDATSCLEEIIFPDYRIRQYLPLNKPVKITLNPPHSRVSEFHCGMNMYKGKVVIKNG